MTGLRGRSWHPAGAPSRQVFLTGLPRSGTTFAGRILSSGLSVDYIHEPFNPDCGIEGFDQLLAYTRLGAPNEPEVRKAVEDLVAYRAHLRTGIYPNDRGVRLVAKRAFGSRGPFHYRLARWNPLHEVALVKDPVGCLLMGYLAAEHGFAAVAVVRHPLGVVHSWDRLGWDARRHLRALLDQPWFVDDHLTGPEAELVRTTAAGDDRLAAVAVLWRVVNRALHEQATRHDVRIICHEDLSARPGPTFRDLFDHLGLTMTRRIERKIEQETAGRGGAVALADNAGPAQQFSRRSAEIASEVLARTPVERRQRVWELTAPVATTWYDEASFGI